MLAAWTECWLLAIAPMIKTIWIAVLPLAALLSLINPDEDPSRRRARRILRPGCVEQEVPMFPNQAVRHSNASARSQLCRWRSRPPQKHMAWGA